jgi:hypothetical protein
MGMAVAMTVVVSMIVMVVVVGVSGHDGAE